MTDRAETSSPSLSRRHRRYPLTLCALAGSAIAIPLYLVSPSVIGEDGGMDAPAQVVDEVVRSGTNAAPSEAAVPPPAEPDAAKTIAAEPVAAMPAEAPVAAKPAAPPPPHSELAGTPVPGAKARADARRKSSSDGLGGLGFVGSGRGSGVAADKAAKGEAGLLVREEGAFAEADAVLRDRGGEDPEVAQQQISAGQLTAGIIDDRTGTKLLDELRAKATALDTQLASALPSHKATGAAPARDHVAPVLEIGLVLDTTGSMGDEIQYLKAEIRSIAQEIANEHPNVTQRYALVAYRDHGDDYVVRGHGFEPLDAFVSHLSTEFAGGGGDFPEAMDEAMDAAGDLPWSSGDAARLVFLVADAPPHAYGYSKYVTATGSLAAKDVSVYPVASSGVEPICEYLMRWAARTTGGQYLFLTDHSGIGNPHADPHVDQFELKSLRAHMLDVIRDELGAREGATPAVAMQPCGYSPDPSWIERHGLFMAVLGGVFLLGFAGDMAMATMRRRRRRT